MLFAPTAADLLLAFPICVQIEARALLLSGSLPSDMCSPHTGRIIVLKFIVSHVTSPIFETL